MMLEESYVPTRSATSCIRETTEVAEVYSERESDVLTLLGQMG